MKHPAPRMWAPALALSLLTHGSAHATGELRSTAVFAVAKDPAGQKAAATADALLRTKAERAKNLRVIEPGRALSGDPRTREEETLERARAAFADGKRAYDALSLDDAIARLGQAVNLYQETGPLLGDLEELHNALLYLGAALTLRGSADEGESAFLELLTVAPSFQPEGFPPTVLKAFERAAERHEKTPVGSVEIYSTPPYAAVYLDGRFEGVTPLTLADLPAGSHYLRLEKIGFTVHGAPLEISANQRITSQTRLRSLKKGVELRDLTARATDEMNADGMGGSLRSLARLVVADAMVFISVNQSGNDASFVGAAFDASSGARLGTERAVLGVGSPTFHNELDGLISKLLGTLDQGGGSAAAVDPGGGGSGSGFGLGGGAAQGGGGGMASMSTSPNTGLPQPVPPEPPTKSEEYLGWTMIGIGGVALAVGGVFGGLSLKVHGDYRDTQQASPDLETIRNDGKRYSIIADACLLGGALVAAGGTVILLIAHRSDPTPEELLRVRAGFVPLEGGGLWALEGALP